MCTSIHLKIYYVYLCVYIYNIFPYKTSTLQYSNSALFLRPISHYPQVWSELKPPHTLMPTSSGWWLVSTHLDGYQKINIKRIKRKILRGSKKNIIRIKKKIFQNHEKTQGNCASNLGPGARQWARGNEETKKRRNEETKKRWNEETKKRGNEETKKRGNKETKKRGNEDIIYHIWCAHIISIAYIYIYLTCISSI